MQQVDNLTLFKLTDELGALLRRYRKGRLQALLDKKKANTLTPDEALELEAIGELDEIFSYINAVMTTRANEHS